MESLRPTWSMQAVDRAHMNTIKQHALNPVESNLEDRPAVEIETFGTTPGDRGLGAERGTIVVSIGILAYNEESSIAGTIESILEQSIVKDPPPGWKVEIVCVPNGCTDRTAEVAGESLAALGRHGCVSHVATKVVPLATPSKENAWNRFVHDLSARDATHLVFMDGDVRLVHPDTIRNLVKALCDDPRAHVAAAETVKHILRKPSKGIFERISMMATGLRRSSNRHRGITGFAGCLYATPAASSRRFVLPSIMRGEDCFLHAIWSTNFFTVPVNTRDDTRVVAAPDATVMFEAYTAPRMVLKNLKRRAVEITINSMIYDRLWAESTNERDAGALLLEWQREDPDWDKKLLEAKIVERGRWVIPGGSFLRWIAPSGGLWLWFHRMKGMSLGKQAAFLPAAMIGTVLQYYAYTSANRAIRSNAIDGLWFTTQTDLKPDRRVSHDQTG